jgi:PAS domain S-box-containing protein
MFEQIYNVPTSHLAGIVQLCLDRNIDLTRITSGTPCSTEQLLNRNNSISWSHFADIFSSAGKFLDEADLRDLGRDTWQEGILKNYAGVGSILFNTRDQYFAIYGRAGYYARNFPLESHVAIQRGDRLEITIRMKHGASVSETFFRMMKGQMESLPVQLGNTTAAVTVQHINNGAVFNVNIRNSFKIFSIARRMYSGLRAAKVITREFAMLQQANERLSRIVHSENEKSGSQPNQPEENAEKRNAAANTTHPAILLDTIANSIPDAIVTFSQDLLISYANPKCHELFGYRPGELIGSDIRDIMPESLADHRLRDFYHDEAATPPIRIELQGLNRGHSLILMEASLASFEMNGTINRICITRDVSARSVIERERRALVEQLHASQKMGSVGQLTGGIAHDFNNILVAILGYADLAQQPGATENLNTYLDQIRKAGERGTDMTQRLLSFSRGQQIEPRLVEANELLHGVRSIIARLLPGDIQVSFSSGVDRIFLMADPTQLEQVLINLAVNARDAMPAGGQLGISLSRHVRDGNDQVIIAVSDTGTGIDKVVQDRIFEPLYTTKPEGRGTGLGLAVIADIIAGHHGHIEVESVLGEGTTFQLRLPAVEPKKGTAKGRRTEFSMGGDETILLVEDNSQVRELGRLILVGAGYRILEAVDGEAAVDLFLDFADEIDLVLMDAVLPKMGGEAASELMRKHKPDSRIAFLTGYSQDSTHTQFISANNYRVIQKPFNTDSLRKFVRDVLDNDVLENNGVADNKSDPSLGTYTG